MHPFISSPLQIAAAAVISMGLAQALHLPDPYWAPISAIVCSLDAFEGASQRLDVAWWERCLALCWQAYRCVSRAQPLVRIRYRSTRHFAVL